MRVRQYSNTADVTVRVPAPSARYLDELLALKSAGELAPFFPNAKEVTESFACFNAVRKHIGPSTFRDQSIACVCPGDGTKPRTAATFAYRTGWTVYSVDPVMGTRFARGRHQVDRLRAHRSQIQNVQIKAPRVVVVACHSHAKLSETLASVTAERIDVVSLPCCQADDIGTPTYSWLDRSCWSPQNRVNVYLDVSR